MRVSDPRPSAAFSFSTGPRDASRDLRSALCEHAEGLKLAPQHGLRLREPQELLDERRVHAPKVCCVLQVFPEHELGQAGRPAVLAAGDAAAEHEGDVRRAVVGAETRVFRHAPSELAVHENCHLVLGR